MESWMSALKEKSLLNIIRVGKEKEMISRCMLSGFLLLGWSSWDICNGIVWKIWRNAK